MKILIAIIGLNFSLSAIAALPQSTVYEQLTGKKQTEINSKKNGVVKSKLNAPSKPVSPKIVASAQKALKLARESRTEKNYILAIKRFNFILKYYSKTGEAKTALIEKSSLYKEMGLNEQATYNLNKLTQLASTKKTVSVQSKQKNIK